MNNVNIVLSSDNNYAQHLGVVLCSIFENKKSDYNINIYIIDGGISKENKEKLNELEKKYHFFINYLYVDSRMLPNLVINGHVTESTYYRILIPKLLGDDIDKVLYLDSDMVVLGDILELFKIDIKNYFVGVVQDMSLNRDKYFNAGMMLINLKKWRDEHISEKTLEYIKNNPEKLEFHDQDALNFIFSGGGGIFLKNIYNFTVYGFENKFKKIKKLPIIIHYVGNIKPWNFSYIGPFKENYFEYLKITPWRDFKYKDKNIKTVIKKIVYYCFNPNYIFKLKNNIFKFFKYE